MTRKSAIAVCAFRVAPGGALQVFPDGVFDAPRGALQGQGPWRMDAAIADRLIARMSGRVNDLVIDYEHQTLLAGSNGRPAPAAGWAAPRDLEYRPGEGLFFRAARWTASAAARIQADEYRYLSPVFAYDPGTGEVMDILHLALTNNPAIDGMDRLQAAAKTHFNHPLNMEKPMNEEQLKALRLALGLDENTGADQVLAAVTAAAGAMTTLAAARAALGLPDDADAAAVTAAVEQGKAAVAAAKAGPGKPDPGKYVPIETMQQLQGQVAALSQSVRGREVDDLIAAARADGKLLPEQEEWARGYGEADLDGLKAYLAKAPAIAALKGTQTRGKPPAAGGVEGLDDEDLAVCRQLGVDPEAYKTTRDAAVAAA